MAELETIADYGTYLPDVSGGDDSLLSPTENVSMNLEPTEENAGIEDEELEAIKARVIEMEEEAEKLKEMQNEVDRRMNLSSPPPAQAAPHLSLEEKGEVNARSVYVGNVVMAEVVLSDALVNALSKQIDIVRYPVSHVAVDLDLGFVVASAAEKPAWLKPHEKYLYILNKFVATHGRGKEAAQDLIDRFKVKQKKNLVNFLEEAIKKQNASKQSELTEGQRQTGTSASAWNKSFVAEAGCDEVDARVSIRQPEVKLKKIVMADLTVKDSTGERCAFHEKKARDHGGCHLGGGSFGEVYKAVHAVHGQVAVKLAKPGKEYRDHVVMYQEEAQKLENSLRCEHIVSIKGFVQCEDDACNCGLIGIVMEYMENGSLWDFRICKWQDRPDLWPLTNRMVYQISSGMHFLHSINIIHRDLKLENVLVDGNLNVKVADLSLAINLQTSFDDKCCGTNSHKPPEAFRKDLPNSTKVVTPKYDVYSFAMTLYELLTGIHPYSDSGFEMLRLRKVAIKEPPSLQPVPVSTPEDLIRVMKKSWSYEPNDRPNFREITDWVANLDTNPTRDSLGHYFGEQRSSKKEGNTDNESVGRGLEDLTVNDHTPVEQSNESPAVAPSQPIFTESPAVAPSQPSSTERDPTIIFDSSQPSDEDFEIKLKVSLKITLQASMAPKVGQIFSCLERCKHRDYWDSSSFSTMFSSSDITLKSLQLPATVDEDDFTLYLRVCNKRDLDKLHESAEKGDLQKNLYDIFVDVHLTEVCHPGKLDLKVESWEEQFNKGKAHFQKKEKANESMKSDSEHSESRQKQPKENKPGPSSTQTNESAAIQINTESKEKVNQQTLLDIVRLIPGKAVKSLGRHLGLEDVRVENIAYENRHEKSSETAYQVLLEWLQQNGQKATKVVLANALWEAECYDAAKRVR